MTVPTPEIVALSRSAAMIRPGERYPIERELVLQLCDELLEHRNLLERLGGDLRAVAAHSRRAASQRS